MNDEPGRREKFLHHVRYFDASVRYPVPFVGFTGRPGHCPEHQCLPYDAAGFLNAEPAGHRTDPNEIRIFVLGDSTMLDGASWQDLVPGRLQDLLRATCSDRVRVFNFGVVSSCTEQMCALIWTRLLDLDPDVLIVLSGGTDAFLPLTFDPRPGYPYNAFLIEYLYAHYFSETNDRSWQSGLDYDGVIDGAFDLLRQSRQRVDYGSPDWEASVARSYEASLRKFVRLARAVDIPVFYALEPIVVRKRSLEPAEASLASPGTLAYLTRLYDRFEAALTDLRVRSLPGNLHLIDASRVLTDVGPGLFTNVVHYDGAGRATVSQFLADNVFDAVRRCSDGGRRGDATAWFRSVFRRPLLRTAR
ncbi:SGNH/GDSL hydrolase family protein [Methylobacterium sp. NEAU 140]|uniref:SGNH/GDSL hydrolase family protein n=1 Tax=Methylobacterium sp. NEAU 140 TaxID=3064945 RepID=UPI00273701F2|nr:SGNH/GDSL hydrolase family protein [Methylobacterium sp. NEAU 140]MDP4025991.1 SGNH/GDSL hydrolase family protein [Methylobacterium sp. NEAU 140]